MEDVPCKSVSLFYSSIQIHNDQLGLIIVSRLCVLQSNCNDRLHKPVGSGLHGDVEHPEVR